MNEKTTEELIAEALAYDEPVDRVEFDFAVDRRAFVQMLGAGLLIAVMDWSALGQEAPRQQQGRGGRGGGGFGRGGGPPAPVAARVHIGQDGRITVMTGKVECGQGARAEITQAAAEELRVPVSGITLIMADTAVVPNDGITAGSGSTPRTLPAVRQGCAAARKLLMDLAAKKWAVPVAEIEVRDGKVLHAPADRGVTYGELAAEPDAAKVFAAAPGQDVSVTPVKQWKVMGQPASRPNGRELVTGAHAYPSDLRRPGMLHGRMLRPPAYGAKLAAVDVDAAKGMKDVIVARDGDFLGVVGPSTFAAGKALEAIAATAKWEGGSTASSATLFEHLKEKARGGMPKNPFAADVEKAAKQFKQEYHVPYVQHAPMETRAAVAEWSEDGKLTVWTATQNPFGVRGELARALGIGEDKVRVVVPDFGGGFGGKHSGECAVECARLAKGVKRPVSLQWRRPEEFTWAYFRPAGVIAIEAGLSADGAIAAWHQVNVNSGPSAVEPPYRIAKSKGETVGSEPPLRHGSYRALASTANVFARECAVDELAAVAGKDPLAFRLAHLEQGGRLRNVLEEAARKSGWGVVDEQRPAGFGVGLACGTEKGSYAAACAEVQVDREKKTFRVLRVVQAYECGAIVNPAGLLAQVQGAIIQGLGPALREEMVFENGRIENAAFAKYLVPRFEDVPKIEVHLVNRPDLPSVGAGETPIIAVAPAIANAVSSVTGTRVRAMPIRIT